MGFVHVVCQGECLISLAAKYGFPSAATLYEHEQNAALRSKRPNEGLLFPGDEVFIPDLEVKAVDCKDGEEHAFRLTLPKTRLRLVLRNDEGAPYAQKRFVLEVDGIEQDGVTDGSGLVDKPIPAKALSGALKLFVGPAPDDVLFIPLDLGALDPIEETSGVQGRLQNLGFSCPITGEFDAATRAALSAYQGKRNLPVTGELDSATRDKLREEVGS